MIQIGIQYPEYIAPYVTTWFAQSIIPLGLMLIWYQMIITSSTNLKYRILLVIVSIVPCYHSLLLAISFSKFILVVD
jgi:hypothetical protein